MCQSISQETPAKEALLLRVHIEIKLPLLQPTDDHLPDDVAQDSGAKKGDADGLIYELPVNLWIITIKSE